MRGSSAFRTICVCARPREYARTSSSTQPRLSEKIARAPANQAVPEKDEERFCDTPRSTDARPPAERNVIGRFAASTLGACVCKHLASACG